MRTILPLLGSTAVLFCLVSPAVADTPANKERPAEDEASNSGVLVQKEAIEKGVFRVKLEHKTASPDGKLFAGYYRDGWDEVISIHDAATGKQIKRIVGHGDDVKEFKFTEDGRFLASRCVNSGRKGWALWDVSTGKLILRLKGDLVKNKIEFNRAQVHWLWMKLSAAAQNVAYGWEKLSRRGDSDFTVFANDLNAIESSLEGLVQRNVLVEETVTLLPREKLGDKGFNELMEFAGSLSKDYGHFVALELMDLGFRRKLRQSNRAEPLQLRVRLPHLKMCGLRSLVKQKNLIRNLEVVITNANDLDKHVGKTVVIRGKLERSKLPSVLGVDLSFNDIPSNDLFGKRVECKGKLQKEVVTNAPPEQQRGNGTYYHLIEVSDKEPVTVRVVR